MPNANDINWGTIGSAGGQLINGIIAGNAGEDLISTITDPSNRSSSISQSSGETYGEGSSQISAEGRATRAAGYDALSSLWNNTDYSRANAIRDIQGSIAELFSQYKNKDLPEIFSSMVSSGGYNSTSHQLLANDAFASTVAKGAALQSQAILNYANARQAQLSPLVSLLNSDRENFNMNIGSEQSSTNSIGAADGGALTAGSGATAAGNASTVNAILGIGGELIRNRNPAEDPVTGSTSTMVPWDI